ncbi:uncharacterized protein Z518_02441 [Rhinocladiella mackenziei CBS 650.93]|uniref:Carrier domain-containing protein n=1 Tax=Rhinocladiella mackenziei CBS 650.93 TaxID=1442369 RepID=A0A0D2FZP8_9EURO|nr:uncharacterized protein Z518_02441 [Rhinocladiella mackenziei CBS 650.93]KIX07787.1 hypothetical protein Z518_02441 [Rhinocladiella mackenziei CBS 650.93]
MLFEFGLTDMDVQEATIVQLESRLTDERLYLRQYRPAAVPSCQLVKFQILGLVDILQSVLSDQDQTVAQVLKLGDHELAELWKWNETVPPAIDRCMHDIVAEKMVEHPEKPAVVSWDGKLTYGELDRLSGILARQLSDLGVGLGTMVPLCFEKSMWTAVGLLAVMRAGGTFVLTDPQQPEARLATIASEVNARVVLTSQKQVGLGTQIAPKANVVVVGPELFKSATESRSAFWTPIPSSAIMYVIFTSGSMGKPKGVLISHENFVTGALPRAEAVGYKPHSRVLDFPSYAFDVSIDCMLCTLSQGGCICIPSDDQRVNDLSGAIISMKVNMAHMTPSVARLLSLDALNSLEVLGLGGEPLSAGDAAIWSKTTKLIIAYGPSECTVGCTINNNITLGRSYTSIGKGVGGVTWIVDPDDPNILSPVGGIGELLIEGSIVGIGYLNEPEKTSQVFIENPTWLLAGSRNIPGRHGRLYKTGDLVKYDPDGSGCIIFVGRKDRQVKLRGQRVELAEIEHHILQKLPEGASVATEVITPGGKDREPSLVAFITEPKDKQPPVDSETGETISFSRELRQSLCDIDKYLTAELPSYMVPTAYIPLSVLPLLVSCKVDRKRLHQIGLAMSPQQLAKFRAEVTENHEPKTDTERALQRIWRQILGADLEIGANDNFFALGGDSLKAMKLVAAARAEGLSLTVSQIFANPTLSCLSSSARRVSADLETDIRPFSLLDSAWEQERALTEVANLCKLLPSTVEDVYPCTPLQEGLMALSAKISHAYIAQRVVDLPDLHTAHLLKAAFEAVAPTCPILRTRIVQVPGRGLRQVVVSGKLLWSSSNCLEEYLRQDRGHSMGLGDALARLAIVTDEKEGKVCIVLTIHHALYDGWSMPLIISRVNKAYQGLKTASPTPFKCFIKYLHDTDRSSSETFWREQLTDATGPQFPVLPYPGYQPQADCVLEHYDQFSRAVNSNTTVATAIRAAWALVAARYTCSDDVVFGETLTGRNAPIPGIETIEGPLITTVPTRVRVNWDVSISDYLQSVHRQAIVRIPHEHMGLQHIRRLSPAAREACELRTGIVLHPNTDPEQKDLGLVKDTPADGFVPVDDIEAAQEALKFNSYALMLVCSLDSNGFLTMASFDSKIVDTAHMQTVLAEFGRTTQELCQNTAGSISDLELLREPSLAELLYFSRLGIRSMPQWCRENAINCYEGVEATWIVDPHDPERLLPVGAVGELLFESREELHLPLSDKPGWFFKGYSNVAEDQVFLYKTEHLSKYSSDGSIVFLGRVDKKTESQPAKSAQNNGLEKQLHPITARQEQLRRLWSRVLRISEEEIGLDSSFFGLGGDSIGVMKLVSEARMEGLELTVAQVFSHRSLRSIAEIIKDTDPPQDASETPVPFSTLNVSDVDAFVSTSILPALAQPTWKVQDVLPARPLQEIAVRGTTHLPRYSVRYEAFYFDAHIDRALLLKSCQDLVSRTEILRTVFAQYEDRYYMVVLEELTIPVVEYEVEGDLESFAKKFCSVDVQTKMTPGSPFVKFCFVQGEKGQNCLIMKISHAQYDEICMPRLLHQLAALYEGNTVPESQPFSKFVYHVIRENIPKSIEYWRELLQGSSMTVLRPEIPLESRNHAAISRTFDISGRSTDMTTATLPTAAWALCLARRLSLRDVTFGEVVSGRNIDLPKCDTVMGPTWQYVPVRVKFEEKWTGEDLLRFVQQQHVDSTRFEGIGLKEIVRNCTDWSETVDWFDSVVHQDVEHVETLAFLAANSRMQSIYPHVEPLREWKIQAFFQGESLTLEIITFESWSGFAESLLRDLGTCLEQLVNQPHDVLFSSTSKGDFISNGIPLADRAHGENTH